jgi:hypothetical protein
VTAAAEATASKTEMRRPYKEQMVKEEKGMGARTQAERKVDDALSKLMPEDDDPTANEISLKNDLSTLRSNLTASQLTVLARAIGTIKKIIYDRSNSN